MAVLSTMPGVLGAEALLLAALVVTVSLKSPVQ